MNGMANNNDDSVECPLCMEPLEVDDLTFFPCTCGYQVSVLLEYPYHDSALISCLFTDLQILLAQNSDRRK